MVTTRKNLRSNDSRIRIVKVTVDQNSLTSDTTLTDVTQLVLPLKINTRYFFLVMGRVTQDNTVSAKGSATVPTGTIGQWSHTIARNVTMVNYGTGASFSATPTGSTFTMYGIFNTDTTAGNLQIQFGQNVSDLLPVVMKEDSCLILIELGGV